MLCAYTRPMQISGERLQDHWSSGYFDVVKFYNFPVFRNYFYCLSNFSLLFQEFSIVNTLVDHLASLTT